MMPRPKWIGVFRWFISPRQGFFYGLFMSRFFTFHPDLRLFMPIYLNDVIESIGVMVICTPFCDTSAALPHYNDKAQGGRGPKIDAFYYAINI